jgi:hypothetical protein
MLDRKSKLEGLPDTAGDIALSRSAAGLLAQRSPDATFHNLVIMRIRWRVAPAEMGLT